MAIDVSRVKKRKAEPNTKARLPAKKFKKQRRYSSGSSDDAGNDTRPTGVEVPQVKKSKNAPLKSALKPSTTKPNSNAEENSLLEGSSDSEHSSEEIPGAGAGDDYESEVTNEEDSENGSDSDSASGMESDGSAPMRRKKTKRHDPSAFANSLSTILASKLPTSKRADPVLSRSRDAQTASHELAESKLETKARRKIRDEKRLASEKGRVKDVLLGDRNDPAALVAASVNDSTEAMSAADIADQERRLRKTAQRGVVKLFNAVRAAQVKGEEAARLARQQGVVGEKNRSEKVGEMGRDAFLEMVGAGAKAKG